MIIEIIKFLFYSLLIVLIAKYILVTILRKLAETLELKPRTVGNIAGVATSVPELLTISFSAVTGFVTTSIYNVLSSNIINLVQYVFSILLNKNHKVIKNKAIRIDLFLVLITILIPIVMIGINISFSWWIVPIFIGLFFLFYYMNNNLHKLYLKKEDEIVAKEIQQEEKKIKDKKKAAFKYAFYLLITSILLFFIGNLLSNALENLCVLFQVPEVVLGIALGFITSLPELITFFESQRHYRKQGKQEEELGVIEATNNLLTSNVLNLFIIQSIGILLFSIFA